jgi:hypothetical protein
MAITTIYNELIAVNAISGTLIADNAITSVHIATNAISGLLVADNSITTIHIAANNVTSTSIVANAITSTQLADNAVIATKIPDGIIATAHLADNAVTAAKLPDNVLTATMLPDNVILATHIPNATNLTLGTVTAALTGNASGTAATVTTAAQPNITSTGTLTSLTVSGVVDFDDYLKFTKPSVKNYRIILHDAGNDFSIQQGDSSDANYATKFNISTDGNVGIGTTSPSTLLDVNGTSGFNNTMLIRSAAKIQFEGGSYMELDSANSHADLAFKKGSTGATLMTLDSNGKVGIGTTSPSDKLDVAGNIAQHSSSFGTTIVNAHSAASTGVNATVEANENRSGVYWLNFNSYKFRAFIRPDWLQGRNWILVAKFFTFSDMPSGSSLWTNDTWVNEGDFDIYSGKFSKYEGWRYFSFNRLAIQMGNRVAPIMQFDSATTLYANFSGGRASNGAGLTADSTDPQIGNSATYHSMEPYIGANFTNMSGSEDMMQSYGLNKWANSATNSTSANNEGSAGLNSDVSQGFQLTVEDAHRHTAGQDSVGVAGAWIGCPMDESGFTFGGDSSNSGSDSGFGMGIGCGNAARTATSGIAEWAQGNRVANYLPAYIWVSID